ncbi:MAG TPA: SMP-30/gluconolactonase/LRE family protein, partial [Polyangiaceae bacterium]
NPPTSGSVTYFAFIEGPVWIAELGTLFFSDNAASPEERIWKLVPPSTTPEVFMEMSGSNGLAIDANDQLILADQRRHSIVRVDPATATVTGTLLPAGDYTPNDLVVRSDGNVYFTDPNSAGRGFYRVSPAGGVTGPMDDVNAPNGIVLSPDETTLYVGDVGNREIHRFGVDAEGNIVATQPTLFVTATSDTVDGMAVDCAGNLYAGTREGVEVYSPEGAPIGTIETGESSNATFGGTDRRTLYVTSRAQLKAVTLGVPGLPD